MRNSRIVLTVIISVISVNLSFTQKIYQWRGDNRQGMYAETNLQKKWNENGPDLLWFTESVGLGWAAPVVTADKLLINAESEGNSYVYAFNLQGKLLWKAFNGKEFMGKDFSAGFPGARSTPTIVGDLVYASSGRGRLACFELATGKEKWAIDMLHDYQGYENEFGYAESPLIDNDMVYFMAGGKNDNVMAFNRFTGNKIWTSKALGDITAFCSPIMIQLPQRKLFVTISQNWIMGIDAKDGALLWQQHLEGFQYEGEHCNTPIFDKGFIYYTAAEDDGNGMVKLELSPDGKTVKEVWTNREVKNAFGGIIKINDQLFTTTKQKKLVCVDAKSGTILSALNQNKGSLIYADGMFYCYNDNGDVKLIKFENNTFAVVSKFKIDKGSKEHFSHPVIANGVLYIRHGNALMAYSIKN